MNININISYGADSITKSLPVGTTVGQVIRNSSIKAVLGYGDSIRALVEGVEMDNNTQLGDGCDLRIETRANSKAADIRVRISYGADGIDKLFPIGTTVGQVVGNSSVKAVLGYGDSIRALIDGVEQTGNVQMNDGCNLVIETKANSKAV